MKALLGMVAFSLLTACAHHAKKVDCDKHLVAINPPAAAVKPDSTPKPTSP
jgi:hypothetical protein